MRTPFLFPHESVGELKHVRDGQWLTLVEEVENLPETHKDSLAFSLMMIRICGCLRCTNYKASLGCTICSQRAVRNSKAPDAMLIRLFQRAKEEIDEFLESREQKLERAA